MIMWIFDPIKLGEPFGYYAILPQPFDELLEIQPVIQAACLQMGVEMVVDVITFYWHSGEGHKFSNLFATIPKSTHLVGTLLSLYSASGAVHAMIFLPDNFRKCENGGSMCCCYGSMRLNRLPAIYCERLHQDIRLFVNTYCQVY